MSSSYVVIETVKEAPQGEALGIFKSKEDAITFIINNIRGYEISSEAEAKAKSELQTNGYYKFDRGHFFAITKTPHYVKIDGVFMLMPGENNTLRAARKKLEEKFFNEEQEERNKRDNASVNV
jgi:hypothetical protein